MPVDDKRADAIRIVGLKKSFRSRGQRPVPAISGIDLTVETGQIFGLLGPNGAGKTTTLRILTTLLPADAGEVQVAGADVRRDPAAVRRRIGYVGQNGGADGPATGLENLTLQGRLYGLSQRETQRRIAELLEALDLTEFAGRRVSGYSGGQRRRLELALGIMHRPRVLFLDEPTTGLDPQNRANLWDQLRQLRDGGTTIFLTTHYLDEADQLSDRLAIVDHGKIIAAGTAAELKREYSGDTITVTPDLDPTRLRALEPELARIPFIRDAHTDGASIICAVTDATRAMAAIFGFLNDRAIGTRSAGLAQPSLDDVFLRETGRSLRDAGAPGVREVAA